MTNKLYSLSAVLFAVVVLALGAAGWVAGGGPVLQENAEGSAPPKDRRFTPAQLGAHSTPTDCWLAIDGVIYDVSTYVPRHPGPPPALVDWCGKEATQAYHTKDRGRGHSPFATTLLGQYRIGILDSTPTK